MVYFPSARAGNISSIVKVLVSSLHRGFGSSHSRNYLRNVSVHWPSGKPLGGGFFYNPEQMTFFCYYQNI